MFSPTSDTDDLRKRFSFTNHHICPLTKCKLTSMLFYLYIYIFIRSYVNTFFNTSLCLKLKLQVSLKSSLLLREFLTLKTHKNTIYILFQNVARDIVRAVILCKSPTACPLFRIYLIAHAINPTLIWTFVNKVFK